MARPIHNVGRLAAVSVLIVVAALDGSRRDTWDVDLAPRVPALAELRRALFFDPR